MSDTIYFFVNNDLKCAVNTRPEGYTLTNKPTKILRNLLDRENVFVLPVSVKERAGFDIDALREFLSDADNIYQQLEMHDVDSQHELDCAIERFQVLLDDAQKANTYTIQQLVSNTVSSHYEPIPCGEFYSEKAAIAGMNELIDNSGFTNLIVTDGNDNVIAESDDQ